MLFPAAIDDTFKFLSLRFQNVISDLYRCDFLHIKLFAGWQSSQFDCAVPDRVTVVLQRKMGSACR